MRFELEIGAALLAAAAAAPKPTGLRIGTYAVDRLAIRNILSFLATLPRWNVMVKALFAIGGMAPLAVLPFIFVFSMLNNHLETGNFWMNRAWIWGPILTGAACILAGMISDDEPRLAAVLALPNALAAPLVFVAAGGASLQNASPIAIAIICLPSLLTSIGIVGLTFRSKA